VVIVVTSVIATIVVETIVVTSVIATVVVETSVIEEIIDDGGSSCGIDVRGKKMIKLSPVQIIRRHALPLA